MVLPLRDWLAGLGIGVLSAAGALMVWHRNDGHGLGPRPGMPLAADLGVAGGAAVAIGLSTAGSTSPSRSPTG